MVPHPGRVRPVAEEAVIVHRSPAPDRVFLYTPGLARAPGGRLIASLDQGGPGLKDLPAPPVGSGQGMVFTSDDRGRTWTYRTHFPFLHARPFVAGKRLYVLGHRRDLAVIASDDNGETWSEPKLLTSGQAWHQSACNVHHANGSVYLVMERAMGGDMKAGWRVSELAPVLMRGAEDADLTDAANWTFADTLRFRDAVDDRSLDFFGVPFFPAFYPERFHPAPRRDCNPMGWLEANVVQITDPGHYWHDPAGRTFHLWMRAHTGGTGYAAIAKVVEQADGSMRTMLETVPSGRTCVFLPCPGGQMRFHVLYDAPTRLYWLLSTQATDSMTRAELLPPERFNLPNNERRRLQLHFSRNMVDWCFAGLVAVGPVEQGSRHYASMIIDGDDLHVLSRSGDEQAHGAHDGNLITFHTIRAFRSLVY